MSVSDAHVAHAYRTRSHIDSRIAVQRGVSDRKTSTVGTETAWRAEREETSMTMNMATAGSHRVTTSQSSERTRPNVGWPLGTHVETTAPTSRIVAMFCRTQSQ